MRLVAWALVFLMSASLAGALAINSASDADLRVNIDSHVTLVPRSDSARIDDVSILLRFVPQDSEGQRVSYIDTSPGAQRTREDVHFVWQSPQESVLNYSLRSRVHTESVRTKVYTPVAYPLDIREIPEDVRQYMSPTETIDADYPAIVSLAHNIADGETDLWKIASKAAIWTKSNIVYNLSTLTESASQSASWVLENRFGVCDELTSLFIALMRALGVPARFISGVAYTTSELFPDGWGAHGWAEVYFPKYGWVPFDPTFGQFGWIDPGHVMLRAGADPAEPSTRFEWRGKDTDLQIEPLDIDATVMELGPRLQSMVRLEADVFRDSLGFGSANMLTVKVTNLRSHYVTAQVNLARVKEMDAIDGWERQVVLEPHATSVVFFRLQVKRGLDKSYKYTIPLVAYTNRNESARTRMVASADGHRYTLADVTRAQSLKLEEASKEYSQGVRLACLPKKREVYEYENSTVACTLSNPGSVPLRNMQVCLRDTCGSVTAPAGGEAGIELPLLFTIPGLEELTVTAKNEEATKSASFEVEMLDEPEASVAGLEAPGVVDYGERFNVSFLLNRTSYSIPQDVRITLRRKGFEQEFTLDDLISRQVFVISMNGRYLATSANDFTLDVRWVDGNGRGYSKRETFTIEMGRINVLQRAWVFLREFSRNLAENMKFWD